MSRSLIADLPLNLRATAARTYVRLVGSIREPAFTIMDAIFPMLGMCAYVLLFRALGAPREYETIAVIGGILSTYWLNVLWGMGTQFYWEKQQGQLQLYFVAPCSRMAILAGMALGGSIVATVRTILGFALGFGVLGVHLPHFNVGHLLIVFVATMGALYALGMILASLFLLFGREAWHLANAVQEPLYLFSGLFFPLSSLGTFGVFMAGLVPVALGVDALRQVVLGDAARGLMSVRAETTILFALAAVFLVIARLALGHLERLAKREGKLTQRGQ